jgi:hypothetical protein
MASGLKVFLSILLLGSVFVGPASAERPTDGIGQWLQEVGVFVGYTDARLKRQQDMNSIPMGMRFGFDLKPFTKKFGWETKGMLELIYEPFLGVVAGPESNVEFALPFFFRYSFPLTSKLLPYVEVGIGPYWTSQHTYEQGTQFNFVSQGGGGLTFLVNDHWGVNTGYRWRHVSNGGMGKPNAGIDAGVITLGASYYF